MPRIPHLVLLTLSLLFPIPCYASTLLVRAPTPFHRLKIDIAGKYAAYVGENEIGLFVLDLKTKDIYQAAKGQVSNSFFWSPDHTRVIYRELYNDPSPKSRLGAFDSYLKKGVQLEMFPSITGPLTFDPRDYRMQFLSNDGLKTRRLDLPDERFATWQIKNQKSGGKWLATQKTMFWVTHGGTIMNPLADDGSGIDSFDISKDGQKLTWATKNAFVYTSTLGGAPKLIGRGLDPRWHPSKINLIYASANLVGDKITSFDLRISDGLSRGKLLTKTQFSNERWPQWLPDGRTIAYTIANTTDLFILEGPP